MPQLRHLSENDDVRFEQGSYDVRNWPVRTRVDDRKVGMVHDILIEDDGRTRYLDVDLEGGRHVLIPSGDARVDPSDKIVHVRGLDREGISKLPDYDHAPDGITSEYARSHATTYDEAYADEHYYERSDYSSDWGAGRDRERREEKRKARESTGELARLDRLDDVDVASDEPDPRGWEVVDGDSKRIGKVDHLIGDTGMMKARYLTVDVDDSIVSDRRILIPVGHVRLDQERKRVICNAIRRERVESIPAYTGDPIDRDYETRLNRSYGQAYTGERWYEHPRYRSRALSPRTSRARSD